MYVLVFLCTHLGAVPELVSLKLVLFLMDALGCQTHLFLCTASEIQNDKHSPEEHEHTFK